MGPERVAAVMQVKSGIYIKLQDGRGIEIHVGRLDKPFPENNKRDFVTLTETLVILDVP